MKSIRIKNFGPIKSAEYQLKKFNVIIGPQSSGKSCVLKISSYCAWVEKRIALAQSASDFELGTTFTDNLISFHKLQGYLKKDTLIAYKTPFMSFSYTPTEGFKFEWAKTKRWQYLRPKISYIPAERNLVSILHWKDIETKDNNISSFMYDWDKARKSEKETEILNLDVKYSFDNGDNRDSIKTTDGNTLELTNSSSGLQSLVPLIIHLKYITSGVYNEEKEKNYRERTLIYEELPFVLYRNFITDNDKTPTALYELDGKNEREMIHSLLESHITFKKIGNINLPFNNDEDALEIQKIYNNLTITQRSDIYIEEPEENLFPTTQKRLVEWMIDHSSKSTFTIATHSPYILTAFLQDNRKDINLLFFPKAGNNTILETASEKNIQEIFDYGVDAFFNIESLSEE